MAITAKELAKKLGVSEAAVSMALNGKAGVSKKRRDEIVALAKEYGYDFSRINERFTGGNIHLYLYTKYRTVIDNTQFFNALIKSIERACKSAQLYLDITYVSTSQELARLIKKASTEIQTGILLLATEMSETELSEVSHFDIPMIVMDCIYNSLPFNYVCINNRQGTYIATDFLLRQFHVQPGYLKSSYSIMNFRERADGFYNAIRNVGLSPSQSITHLLAPSFEGAYADMKQILENGDKLARCYFADNDLIALGAMKAFKEHGYRIPRDIAIIGFDNIPMGAQSDNSLSSVNVPQATMGFVAVERLHRMMKNRDIEFTVTSLINTSLIIRSSTDL